ncbi:translation initiation factor eIF2 subunit beta SCDLUD_001153 [Saccharomycodes ludwigii]|uniref:translation initiation factor eIF2 subunit beta n=1 Tax=Saccharomycodes ludwigii TaxID=36035 RepID=UPI001E84B811|nr:hypothetical protein SCDLUD_001153 [Saccharomycodes ludwigii]KAH3903512.1 hypothetical protein SCDLUD_001153 [Saccharomycodes ludwigii]
MSDLTAELGFDPSLKKKKKTKKTISAQDFDSVVGNKTEGTSVPTNTSSSTTNDEDLFVGLKKKKKKIPASFDAAVENEKTESSPAPSSSDAQLDDITNSLGDLSLKKKKKKKKAPSNLEDFDKALEKAGIDVSATSEQGTPELSSTTSSTASSSIQETVGLPYKDLLTRFFNILRANNPELAGERTGTKFRIPPPVCQRDGKKSIFVNIQEISEKLQRNPEHLIQYLFAELGTSGSVDGQKRLVIKGKFQSKQMEGVLRRYIIEYVTCKTCKSINTELKKEQSNRLFFLVCKSCGSTRSVSSIKSGFQATVKRIKK